MARGVIPPLAIEDIPAEYRETADMMSRLVGDATTARTREGSARSG